MPRSQRRRGKRYRHRTRVAATSARAVAVGTEAAASVAGISRRTLARRVADGSLTVERDAKGRFRFGIADLGELSLRAAGRPPGANAALVDHVSELCAGGFSLRQTAARLEADGVDPPHGGARWWPSTVAYLLRRSSRGS